jgi:hypothetical protein
MTTIKSGITATTKLSIDSDNTGILNIVSHTGIINMSNSIGYMKLPQGTTVQRPSAPQMGTFRYNTTTSTFELYNGTTWTIIS